MHTLHTPDATTQRPLARESKEPLLFSSLFWYKRVYTMAMDCAIRETKRERERERERAHNMRGHGESLSEPHNWTCRYGEHVISDPEFNAIQRMQIQACELEHSHLTSRDLFPFIHLNLAPDESLPRSQTRISIFIYCRDVQY